MRKTVKPNATATKLLDSNFHNTDKSLCGHNLKPNTPATELLDSNGQHTDLTY